MAMLLDQAEAIQIQDNMVLCSNSLRKQIENFYDKMVQCLNTIHLATVLSLAIQIPDRSSIWIFNLYLKYVSPILTGHVITNSH